MITRSYIPGILLILLLLVASSGISKGQILTSLPEASTNRWLDNLNDASAIGWNPAALGVSRTTFDLLASADYSSDIFAFGSKGVFARLRLFTVGIGGGIVWPGDSGGPNSYHLGFGVPVIANSLWAGVGVRWFQGSDLFRGGEYSLGVSSHPFNDLYAGIGVTNLNGNNNAKPGVNGHVAYNLAEWLTLVGGVNYNALDTIGGKSPVAISPGFSMKLDDGNYVLSARYDFNHGRLNVGVEGFFDSFGLGILNTSGSNPITKNYESMGGVWLARYSSKDESEPEDPGDHPPRRRVASSAAGWAPDRAYKPSSVYYRIPTSDAGQTMSALSRPCNSLGPIQFDTPDALAKTVERSGPPYTKLAQTLRALSPNPANLYQSIRKQYYSTRIRSRELSSGDSLQLLSKQGYAISVQSVDASKAPEVNIVMNVADASGNTVSGLGINDFRFKDPSIEILSVKPIDSSLSIPVDIVLLIDCSGSMSEEISAVRARVEQFVKSIEAKGIDSRIGGVMYGAVVYDTLHPTSDFKKFREFAANAAAIGNDEITSSSIIEATTMNFRPDAQRIFVLITDDWAIQENSRLNEPDLVEALWNTRARLYSIIDPCKNNAAVATRLTLGKEFNINSSFNSILNDIGSDLTTSYQLTYRSKLKDPLERVTLLRGKVKDELGRPVGLTFALKEGNTSISAESNPTTGDYSVDVPEGKMYSTTLSDEKHLTLNDRVNMTSVQKGDTVTKDFTLMLPPTRVSGQVTDETGKPQESDVSIDDARTLQRIATIRTNKDGRYDTTIKEGQAYRFTARKPDYIPTPADLDATNVEKGSKLTQDLKIMSLDEAIKTGATFRLQNIFFDYDKADLKPGSFSELDRLASLLKEYPQINVEIGAHTDGNGTDAYNVSLSEKRAKSVVDYLIDKGVASARLRAKGFGKSVPIASNDTEEGRAQNRRVEFKVVK